MKSVKTTPEKIKCWINFQKNDNFPKATLMAPVSVATSKTILETKNDQIKIIRRIVSKA
jgi:hypothetical protein